VPDYHLIAAEFALGRVRTVTPLSGGGSDVAKLTTTSGVWVVKPGRDRTSAELYPRVASVLNAAGLRQAVPCLTVTGSAVSASGYTVQEFLPGQVCLRPTAAQIVATMRHVAEYHETLKALPSPAELSIVDSIWRRVASAGFLLREVPGLLVQPGRLPEPAWRTDARQMVGVALGLVHDSLPLTDPLPRQLVHGDIGPDNVLMDGDDVVAILDFTAHEQPYLFALSTAVYWYHIYGRDHLDVAAISASLAAAAPSRSWTDLEADAWPAMLIREALRRLATPLAVAEEAGTSPDPVTTAARCKAVESVIQAWPNLPDLPYPP